MKTYSQLCSEITNINLYGGCLQSLKSEWELELKKIDTFISMFLEKYGTRIIGEKKNTPEWVLYSAKTEQFSNYTRALRQLDYFLAKEKYAV